MSLPSYPFEQTAHSQFAAPGLEHKVRSVTPVLAPAVPISGTIQQADKPNYNITYNLKAYRAELRDEEGTLLVKVTQMLDGSAEVTGRDAKSTDKLKILARQLEMEANTMKNNARYSPYGCMTPAQNGAYNKIWSLAYSTNEYINSLNAKARDD